MRCNKHFKIHLKDPCLFVCDEAELFQVMDFVTVQHQSDQKEDNLKKKFLSLLDSTVVWKNTRFNNFQLFFFKLLWMCLCSEGVSLEEREDARVSWRMRDERTWGVSFLRFLVRDVKERRQGDSEEGFVVPSECNNCRNKMLIFSCCTGVNGSSC